MLIKEMPTTKKELMKFIEENDFNFNLKMEIEKGGYITGITGTKSVLTDAFSIHQFFNSFNNTKNNAFRAIDEYLHLSEENILPINSNFISEMFNPYMDNAQYYSIENLCFRIGSLWDILAHICNILYGLNVKVKKVDSNIFKDSNIHKHILIKNINDYFNDNESFADMNCHQFCNHLRNRLIHYCDFKSIKFESEYIKSNINLKFYPNGYYLCILINDLLKAIDFAKLVYEEFITKYVKE